MKRVFLFLSLDFLCEPTVAAVNNNDGVSMGDIGEEYEAATVDRVDEKVGDNEVSKVFETCKKSQYEEIIGEIESNGKVGKANTPRSPPSHFRITAHIQTNLHTGSSYFIPQESLLSSFAHLPFLECGAIGSTTEGLPLVSGVFRHVPHTALVPERDHVDVALDDLDGFDEDENVLSDEEDMNCGSSIPIGGDSNESNETSGESRVGINDRSTRTSPPMYVVALSSMEITVGGNGNETQKFDPGDIIFIEDTWWGVWDDASLDIEGDVQNNEAKMKGYIMRASPESSSDLNTLVLTVPNAIHRHWKNARYAMAIQKREQRVVKQQEKQLRFASNESINKFGPQRPWWKYPSAFIERSSSGQHQTPQSLPILKPCSLESDPAFAHPSTKSSSTLSQHFTQHFTGILRRSTNPHPSFLPHHHQDLLLPIVAQTLAAAIGGATALALVLQLWRMIPGPTAVGFGSLCLIGAGTMSIVWLGEEILDQWKCWRERKRVERMVSEGWGRVANGGGRATEQ